MRVIKVLRCDTCPYYVPATYTVDKPFCRHDDFEFGHNIKNPNKIPKWCPLEIAE